MLVVAGLRGPEHADRRCSRARKRNRQRPALDPNGYPIGYWGSISPGFAKKYASIRKAWQAVDADNVHYYWKPI